jgi:hypothetical protein
VSALGKIIDERTAADFAADRAIVTPRFLVPSEGQSHTPLTEWVEQCGVSVGHTEGSRHDGDTATITRTDDGQLKAPVENSSDSRTPSGLVVSSGPEI